MSGPVSFLTALGRGFTGRCPNCGKGRLFRAFLKPVEHCAVCNEAYAQYRADDGPAYFTILIVGHLVVGPMLFFPWVWRASALIVVPTTLIPLIVLTLLLLPRVKGAFISLLWRQGARAHEHAPGSELAASERQPAQSQVR